MEIGENCQWNTDGKSGSANRIVISGLGRHLAAAFTFAKIAQKLLPIERKLSVEHLYEIGVGESDGDNISGLKRHLAAKFTFAKITRKLTPIDEKFQ